MTACSSSRSLNCGWRRWGRPLTKSWNWKSGLMLIICKKREWHVLETFSLTSLSYRQVHQAPEKFSDRVGGWHPGLLILSPVDFPPTPTLIPTPLHTVQKKKVGERIFLNHEEIHSKVKKKNHDNELVLSNGSIKMRETGC